jgi:hypothetical protein
MLNRHRRKRVLNVRHRALELIAANPQPLGPRARLYPLAAQAQDADASPSSRGVHRPEIELGIVKQCQGDLPAGTGRF